MTLTFPPDYAGASIATNRDLGTLETWDHDTLIGDGITNLAEIVAACLDEDGWVSCCQCGQPLHTDRENTVDCSDEVGPSLIGHWSCVR